MGSKTIKQDRFFSNLINLSASYDIGPRFDIGAGIGNYILRFDDPTSSFRDRTDNSFSAVAAYKTSPRTRTFIEYQFIDVKYEQSFLPDSTEQSLKAGFSWNITDKTKGVLKAGYGKKKFKDVSLGESKLIVLEAQAHYNFTSKSWIELTGLRKTAESDLEGSNYMIQTLVSLKYLHKLTSKLTGSLAVSYEKDTYKGHNLYAMTNVYPIELIDREDKLMSYSAGLRYSIKEWLETVAGYTYSVRTSNFSDNDYTNNTIFLRVTGIKSLF